ncbi:hypothetical protein A8C56_23250 [Niabella ginsenosidivorans]|uniref:SecDF P1 head subdomain domain-containing protein n=1 Tax=Niabella ginsenosidivorans TaxID=1176587 RepID=A0A1A9I9V5_9BACT|nr:hypothetical protein [Niabella ginsenosidivorans]ANH83502.1 hypothetical protein A8C56_23250 [Niabella ginsenosidivorans]
MKRLLFFSGLFMTAAGWSQTTAVKIDSIIHVVGYNQRYNSSAVLLKLDQVKQHADTADIRKIEALERELSDTAVSAKMSRAFLAVFTEPETDSIYRFLKTPAGKKFFQQQHMLDAKIEEQFVDLTGKIQHTRNGSSANKAPDVVTPDSASSQTTGYANYPAGAVNRADGFYLLTEPANNTALKMPGKRPVLTFKALEKAILYFDDHTAQPVIRLELTTDGAKAFQLLTHNNTGKQLAVLVDKKIIMAPVINGEIAGGRLQIAGAFSVAEATGIVKKLNAAIRQ